MSHRLPMDYSQLDNLIWHALTGPHRRLAESWGDLRWYPSAVAPFIAAPSPDVIPDLDEAARRGFRAPAYFLGVLPDTLPCGWHFVSHSQVLQMLPTAEPAAIREDDMRVLGVADRPAMLALTRAAFPDFFRERTAELGEYLGIFDGAQLVAMAGERIALDGLREISGVCTHPAFAGRGSARRLTSALMNRHRQRGVASFLHVSVGNAAARRLYGSMGLTVRAGLAMGKVERSSLAVEA